MNLLPVGDEEGDLPHVTKNVQFWPLETPALCKNAKSKQRILLFSVKRVFVSTPPKLALAFLVFMLSAVPQPTASLTDT